MGNKYPPRDPVVEALAGDEDAIEEVLVSVHAPVFDLALHLAGAARAAELTIGALRELCGQLRDGHRPEPNALAMTTGILIREFGDQAAACESTATLAPQEQIVLLASLATELDRDELGSIVGLSSEQFGALYRKALEGSGATEEALRDAMDEVASETPLPHDLIDNALSES